MKRTEKKDSTKLKSSNKQKMKYAQLQQFFMEMPKVSNLQKALSTHLLIYDLKNMTVLSQKNGCILGMDIVKEFRKLNFSLNMGIYCCQQVTIQT